MKSSCKVNIKKDMTSSFPELTHFTSALRFIQKPVICFAEQNN